MKKAFFALILMAFVSGCGLIPITTRTYEGDRASIKVGMSKQEFLKIFPDAVLKMIPLSLDGNKNEAYEVKNVYYSVIDNGSKTRDKNTGMDTQIDWYYFRNDKFIKYGNPNEWPNK